MKMNTTRVVISRFASSLESYFISVPFHTCIFNTNFLVIACFSFGFLQIHLVDRWCFDIGFLSCSIWWTDGTLIRSWLSTH